jgi:hypothetical protein
MMVNDFSIDTFSNSSETGELQTILVWDRYGRIKNGRKSESSNKLHLVWTLICLYIEDCFHAAPVYSVANCMYSTQLT